MATYNVLFLCTGNSARSIMAEALITVLGADRFKGYSAGSHPGGVVNRFAAELVQNIGYPADTMQSKSWDEFATADAPPMDFIITVCDNAAGETCPVWPGRPVSAHWGFEDPAAASGTEDEKRAVFRKVFDQIKARVQSFVSLPLEELDPHAVERQMKEIGETSI